jgi:hypothetical protein
MLVKHNRLRGWRFAAHALEAIFLLALVACQGPNGDDGNIQVRFVGGTAVTQMTLTGIGVPITNALTSPSTVYTLDRIRGPLTWTVNSPSTVNYAASVDIEPNKGSGGKDGELPPNNIITGIAAKKGDDGSDQHLVFLMHGSVLYVLTDLGSTAGTPLP